MRMVKLLIVGVLPAVFSCTPPPKPSSLVLEVSPDNTKIGFRAASGAPALTSSGSLPLARTGTVTSTNDACATIAGGSLSGKAVLIRRGGCEYYLKAKNAQEAGATMVIVYNTDGEVPYPDVTPPSGSSGPAITIPVVGTSKPDGELLDARIAAGAVTLSWRTE